MKSIYGTRQIIWKGCLFVVPGMPVMTKLWPFVRDFLKEANTMFEMYIHTMGDSCYAAAMATLLDPERYFYRRVISRNESTQKHQKDLDLVLTHESAVIILDDTEAVWPKHTDNLILIERYNFFASSRPDKEYVMRNFQLRPYFDHFA
ncbi:hypothetical protein QQ045_000211 [Rhodiola kirilowii]